MYCPQCGHRQINGGVQFCSSCGFPLWGVRHVLAAGGALPASTGKEDDGKPSPRRRGINQGIVMLLFAMLLVPLIGIVSNGGEETGVAAVLFFGGGLARILYALLLQCGQIRQERKMPVASAQPAFAPPAAFDAQERLAHQSRVALPDAPGVRLNTKRRFATGELVPPPSVTDHTTRLLEHKEASDIKE